MTLSSPPQGEIGSPPVAPSAGPLDDTPPVMVESNPMGVRAALAEMRARFSGPLPQNGTLNMAETVLAEVLNNVVEHAYAGTVSGPIELRMQHVAGRLKIDVRDYGKPMPGGDLPGGALPADDFVEDAPPEGGFGWFLIRAFARNIAYERADDQNRLTFDVPLIEDV